MNKKLLIALADIIKEQNKYTVLENAVFNESHINTLADFCQKANPNFKRQRWIDYIAGKCGENGGKV